MFNRARHGPQDSKLSKHNKQMAATSLTFAPGPVNPSPLPSSLPPPGLPLPFSPISQPSVSRTTVSLSDTTFTFSATVLPVPTEPGIQSSPIVTSPVPTFTPEPLSFAFQQPFNTTTCNSLSIEWTTSDSQVANQPSTDIDLGVNSVGNSSDFGMNITTNWPVSQDIFTWSPVSVNPGQYRLTGRWSDGHGSLVVSPPFTVGAGSNTSCLTGVGVSSASSKSVNSAAIAGGATAGALLLLFSAVGLYFLCGARERRNKRGRGSPGAWAGLDSVDSSKGRRSRRLVGENNGYLGDGATPHNGSLPPPPPPHFSEDTLDVEEKLPVKASSPLSTLESQAAWMNPPVELAPISPKSPDSPRSSLDDPFTAPPSRRASRTPRKPVPAYEPSPEELQAMEMGRTRSDQSSPIHPNSNDSPNSAELFYKGSPPPPHHELRAKSSGLFDGKPVHYLIPDMPPQPQE